MSTNVEKKSPTLRFPEFEENWKIQKVIELLDKIIDYRGKAPPKSEEGVTLITARNVKAGHLDFSSREFINHDDYDDWMNRGLPDKGDVIFTTEAPLGNVCMFPKEGKYALGQRTITLRAKQNVNSGLFVFYLLQSSSGMSEIASRATGSTAKGIKSKVFQKIPLSVPELAEQEKIASFLDAIASHLTQLRRKHDLLQTYKRGVMQKIFSQQIRFKQDDGTPFPDWEKKKLGELLTVRYGKDHKNLEDGEYPVLGTGGIMRYANAYLYDKPSILIGRKGTIDQPQFVTYPFWTVDTLFYSEIHPEIIPFFLFLVVQSINWQKYNEATGVPSLNTK